MLDYQSKIQVLTPSVNLSNNQYLACLWSSVKAYGIEIEIYQVNRKFSQIKADKLSNQVIHLHWIKEFCKFNPNSKYRTLRSILGVIRNLIFLKSHGNKIVWTIHNTLRHENNFLALEYILRWFLSRFCDDIMVMSKYSQEEFARMYGRTKRVHIIPHGNYIDAYPNKVNITQAREKLGIAPQKKVLLHLGRIQRYKGIDNLLAQFAQIKDPNVILLIAGVCKDLDLLEEIKQAASVDSRILLRLEFIEDEDIQLYMNACDWAVLPYQKILNSGSALLAISFSRPVIVPQQGSITELIEDGKQGYCYEKDGDLLTTLNRALATPHQEWEQMCSQAYTLAQKYDWSKIGYQLYQVYLQQESR